MDQDAQNALEAAQLAVASDDYHALERAGLALVGLARRGKADSHRAE
ncbi:hypothetical protein [Haloarchaeobius sp. TZWWS8]